jgi:uncharacterized protein (DUF2141 family)
VIAAMRLLGVALLLCGAAPAACAAELVITVENIRSAAGDIRLSVYATPEEWPDNSARDHDQVEKAALGHVVFRFELPPRTYAVNGFHDENGNGKFDTNFLGIPEEGYFFSNNVRPFLSAPSFAAASFPLPPEGAAITVRVVY